MLGKSFVYLGKNKTIDYALENTKGLVESSLLYFPLSNENIFRRNKTKGKRYYMGRPLTLTHPPPPPRRTRSRTSLPVYTSGLSPSARGNPRHSLWATVGNIPLRTKSVSSLDEEQLHFNMMVRPLWSFIRYDVSGDSC